MRVSIAQVYGVNLTAAVADVTSIPQINQTLAYFSSPAGIKALKSANDTISTAVTKNVQQAAGNFSQINGVRTHPSVWCRKHSHAYALPQALQPGKNSHLASIWSAAVTGRSPADA